jgi:hypothetical protein
MVIEVLSEQSFIFSKKYSAFLNLKKTKKLTFQITKQKTDSDRVF